MKRSPGWSLRATVLGVAAALTVLGVPGAVSLEMVSSDAPRTETRTINEDYLFAGESLDLQGIVESLYFVGESLALRGEATGNLVAAGERVELSGSVGDDSIVAGRDVSLAGRLGSTVFVTGGSVTLDERAVAEGTVLAAGGTVRIHGRVRGDLYSGARRLVISGRVDGDVHAGAEEIEIRDGASIAGAFTYYSGDALSDREAAMVDGRVERRERDEGAWRSESPWLLRLAKRIAGGVFALSLLVFSLLFYLFPGVRRDVGERSHRRFWITVAWGLIPFFGYPLAVALLFAGGILFGITIPVATAFLFGAGFVAFVLTALALPEIGVYVATSSRWWLDRAEKPMFHWFLLLGFAVVFVASFLPIVRGLVGVAVLSLGWGIALERLFAVRFGER